MDLRETLKTLSRASGPSGFETEAEKLVAGLLSPYADEISTDALGNVVALRKCGKADARRVLLDAHIDEVGFIITGHENGFLRFAPLGSVDARLLPASRLKILTEPPVYGVIDVMAPHLLSGNEADKIQKIEELYIDTGLSAEEAERLIPVGTPAVYMSEPLELGEKLLSGKAFDDRACLLAVLRALELLCDTKLGFDLYVLASTQEELGRRGAQPGAFEISPDYAIILDVDHAVTPDGAPHKGKPLGSGAVIARGPNMNRIFTDSLIATAKKYDIAHTVSVEPGDSGTNAKVIQTVRAGVKTALVGVPLRYMHSPSETVNVDDIEAAAQLVYHALKDGDFIA